MRTFVIAGMILALGGVAASAETSQEEPRPAPLTPGDDYLGEIQRQFLDIDRRYRKALREENLENCVAALEEFVEHPFGEIDYREPMIDLQSWCRHAIEIYSEGTAT